MAAEVEEVVVDAHRLDAEHLAPRSRSSMLLRGVGAPRSSRPARRRSASGSGSACGRPCRSASAEGRPERTNAAGHHVLGQLLCRKPRSSSATRRSLAVRDRRKRPGACRPPALRASTTASRTRGCCASAASISPSSMRKPRILTWWSRRPRNSSSPSGTVARQVAGAVQALRPAPPQTGRARTAPRSARAVQVAARQPGAADVQLARHARRAPAAAARRAHRPACWRSAARSAPRLRSAGSARRIG